MIRRSPIVRVSVGIALVTLTLMLLGDVIFGLSTEGTRPQLMARKHLAETLAVQYSDLASRDDFAAMQTAMTRLVERNPEVLSTAVRRNSGGILAEAGDHRAQWRGAAPLASTATHTRVPIFDGAERWGTLEVRFREIAGGGFLDVLATPWFKLLGFMVLVGSVAYFLYMRRTLRHLDPSSVIPARVKAAFDVLAEGVAFIDREERIVLANKAFARLTGHDLEALMGTPLRKLGWVDGATDSRDRSPLPWVTSMQEQHVETGCTLLLESAGGGRREFMVNAAPVLDDARQARGAIVTFDDVTELEAKKQELERAVTELRNSRDEVRRQNEKLEFIANRDPLTHCLNRRSFVEALEREVACARRDGTKLTCLMLDIDHFKSVNDTFGHLVGDDAIRFVAGVVSEVTRGFDIVCRYGGEEFCVLMPSSGVEQGFGVAERIRESVAARCPVELPQLGERVLTVSVGLSSMKDPVDEPMDLVDRADGALYRSKTSGRNRTTVADAPEAVSVA